MGFFGNKKKHYVSSTVYNLAGDDMESGRDIETWFSGEEELPNSWARDINGQEQFIRLPYDPEKLAQISVTFLEKSPAEPQK